MKGSGLVGTIALSAACALPLAAQQKPIRLVEVRPVASTNVPDSVDMIMAHSYVPEDKRNVEHAGSYSPVQVLFCTSPNASLPDRLRGMYMLEMKRPGWLKRQSAELSGHEGYSNLVTALRRVTPMNPGSHYRVPFSEMLERASKPPKEQSEYFKIYLVDESLVDDASCPRSTYHVDPPGH